ncbi:MAG: hypothetical protein KGH66_02060 [Candidatus Micrarchaeota archaeon]|nr:hypothetical protein [Candidatus Micrarchaeota archaeon]
MDNDMRAHIAAAYMRLDNMKFVADELGGLGIQISVGGINSTLRRAGVQKKHRSPPTDAQKKEIFDMSKTMTFNQILEKTGLPDHMVRRAISTGNDKEMAKFIMRKKG